ncbi:MAG: cytochrome oxidase subunit [Gammaproteobacteria bacterium]|jgi:cytochrome oxidase Cu insertion factor (SCO1/SenC/PrrC family)|nr:cytochrome oxidase subunit [Gammaproteobacteria bacterium]
MKTKQSARWTLIGLLLIFILPMLLAWYVYLHPSLLKGQTNYGRLFNPPLRLAELPLYPMQGGELFDKRKIQGKWTLLYIDAFPCQTTCQENLYKMRQVRIALGKERERVSRWLLLTTEASVRYMKNQALLDMMKQDYSGTLLSIADSNELNAFFKLESSVKPNGFYVIDPLGNIILSYPAGVVPDHLFKDLKHLLKVSQIG